LPQIFLSLRIDEPPLTVDEDAHNGVPIVAEPRQLLGHEFHEPKRSFT
jgi:hypothetical protein